MNNKRQVFIYNDYFQNTAYTEGRILKANCNSIGNLSCFKVYNAQYIYDASHYWNYKKDENAY